MKRLFHIAPRLARILCPERFQICAKRYPSVSDRLVMTFIATFFLTTPTFAQTYSAHPITDLPQLGNSTAAWGDYNNDGYPDFLIAGTASDGDHITELFRNNGNGTFSRYHSFTAVTHASIVWGDVDGNNFLDFHLTGLTPAGEPISELYINRGDETFALHSTPLEGVSYGASALADFDQDGDLDLLYTGSNADRRTVSKYYENQDTLFAPVATSMPGFTYGSLDVADYNRDGYPDLLLTGLLEDGNRATHVYRNEGNAQFTFLNTVLPPVSFGEAAWGDVDHDGYADIALSGATDEGNPLSKIYRNNQNEVFTDLVAGLQPLGSSSVAWLDYDNDGYSDLFITGGLDGNAESRLYRNNQDASFTLISNTDLLAVYNGDISITDHDRDGNLDVFATGYNNRGGESQLHTNTLTNTNATPSVPNGLLAFPSEDSLQLQWNSATDAETPDAGLSYQVYVGTAPDQSDLVPAHALFADGTRTVTQAGNAGYKTSSMFRNVPEGRYYWAVQSFDASNRSSVFSTVGSFDICYAITLGADTAICAGDTIALQLGTPDDQVDWESTGGVAIADQRSVAFPLYQTDTIYATLTNPLGCVRRDTLVVQVYDLPVADLGADTGVCLHNTLLLTAGQPDDHVDWYSLRQGLLATDSTQLAYLGIQTDTLWIEVTNPSGCVRYDTVVVTVHELPVVDAGADQLICQGESTPLGVVAKPGYTYQWQPSVSLSDAAVAQPIATPDTTTTYVLQVTTTHGCINYDTVTVTVNPPTLLDTGGNRAICFGESTTLGGELTAQGAILEYRYEWFPSTSLDNAFVANPMATPEQTTEYTLVARAGDCLPDTAHVTVTVHALPVTSTSEDITIGAGETTPINATGGVEYAWFPTEGLSRSDVADPFAAPAVTTEYVVTVTNEHGCSNLDTVTVFVDNRVFVPNLFSPNGDGQNDVFKVYGAGIETLDLQVYDRQGNRVYHASSVAEVMETGWDGTWQGTALPSGNYRWVIRGQFYDGKVVTFEGKMSGKVRLIR